MIIKMKHLDTNSSFQRIQQHSDYNKSFTLMVRTTLVCCETIKHHHSNNSTTLKYKKCSTKSPPQWLQQRLSTMKQEICHGCGAIVGAVGQRSPRKRKVGCLNPSYDRQKQLIQVVTAPLSMLGNRCECHGSSALTIINGCPVSQQVWHAKEPSLLNGH